MVAHTKSRTRSALAAVLGPGLFFWSFGVGLGPRFDADKHCLQTKKSSTVVDVHSEAYSPWRMARLASGCLAKSASLQSFSHGHNNMRCAGKGH